MDDVKKDLILREIYYSPKVGFRSIKHVWEQAKEEDSSITEKDVKEWLEKQHTYSKYKSFNSPSFFRKTMVRYLGEQMQIDLVFLEKHRDQGYHIILNCIEILSRFAFSRPLKTKSGREVKEALKNVLDEFKEKFHDYPKLLQADEGNEFYNKDVNGFLRDHDIILFSTSSRRKASIVERYNRTLKDKLRKLHDSRGNHKWVDDLPDIVENYNDQVHSSIGMKPKDVNSTNQYEVWHKLYGHIMNHVKEPKYKVGENVRVLRFNPIGKGKKFGKCYKEKYPDKYEQDGKLKGRKGVGIDDNPFSDEIFTIDKVLYGDPVVYKLYSKDAEMEILGKFYESELSLVR